MTTKAESNGKTDSKHPSTHGLRVDWWVVVYLREPISNLRAYVGQVQHVGEDGLRITGIDWFHRHRYQVGSVVSLVERAGLHGRDTRARHHRLRRARWQRSDDAQPGALTGGR
jgi:hypothetical protein